MIKGLLYTHLYCYYQQQQQQQQQQKQQQNQQIYFVSKNGKMFPSSSLLARLCHKWFVQTILNNVKETVNIFLNMHENIVCFTVRNV